MRTLDIFSRPANRAASNLHPNRLEGIRRVAIGALLSGLVAGCASTGAAPPSADATGAAPVAAPQTETPISFPQTDAKREMLWLEEVLGDSALAWVKQQNTRSLAKLEADPRYSELFAEALAIANNRDRIPFASQRGEHVYNYWQDQTNVRGIWRRATTASYLSGKPEWETVFDLDAVSKAEEANWVWKGASWAPGDSTRVILTLSDGGKDASHFREYDVATKSFVEGGFTLTEAKQSVTWIDNDRFLVATDWGGETMTESGYPFVAKVMTRGMDKADATLVLSGQREDVGLFSGATDDGDTRYVLLTEADSFFSSTQWLLGADLKPVRLPLPEKATARGVHKGQVIATLEQDWTAPNGQALPQGALISFPIEPAQKGEAVSYKVIMAPGARESLEDVGIASTGIIVTAYENVRGRAFKFTPETDGSWKRTKLDLPDNGAVSLVSTDNDSQLAFVTFNDFLTPSTLYALDTASLTRNEVQTAPKLFEAEGLVVEQKEAISKDGIRVPYFVIRKADTKMDGNTPTLLYAYGGFQISMLPAYSGYTGKLWLENGGAYVLANIRGGGEFGPAWHQAGLKTERQRIYDDFIAVGESLISSGLTSPRRLGIMGGSNGGLLMGVMLTQRPDLWNAVVVQVPLLDMLRYHLLLAGASWVDEYGSPEVAEERAFLETISPVARFDAKTDYPMPFFVTSTKDDRVHPGHARKLARLFEDTGKPFLYYENIDGGHSAAANLNEGAKRRALEWTYLFQQLAD